MTRKTQILLHIKRRLFTPAGGFLLFTIVLSIAIFILSMRSGVQELSLPALSEITSANVRSLKQVYRLEKGIGIISVTYSPDGRYLAVARQDNTLHIWSTQDYQLIYTFNIEPVCIDCVAFSPDSRYIASVREAHPDDVIVWDTETGKSSWESISSGIQQSGRISCLVFSPDGGYLAEAIGNKVLFWQVDLDEFKLVREIEGFASPLDGLAFSPDGKQLLTIGSAQTTQVWDVDSGNWVMTLDDGSQRYETKGIFSPDGKWIVTTEYNGKINFWDSRTGAPLGSMEGTRSPIGAIVFSPNSQLLASSGNDNHVQIWDAQTRKVLLVISGNNQNFIPIAFSPDNKIFVTTNPDETLRFWGIAK